MVVEAMIRRIPKGGTRSVRGLAKQLGYVSRQTDPAEDNVLLVGAQRHQFNPGTPDAIDPNNVWAFARRLYARSGHLPPGDANAVLRHDLTMHFVISFPPGTNAEAAQRAGRDWAEYVFGHGFPNAQGHVNRHDYVTAFHDHGAENDHPHMHVIVDRVPLGGGHLLTLAREHPHWSYAAMRLQAVEAGANHGIALVATPIAVDMPRPITAEEAERRRVAARRVPYHDPNFDGEGHAPGAQEGFDAPTLEAVRQTCEPVLVPEPEFGGGPGDDPGDDAPDDGGDGGGGAGHNHTSQAPSQGASNTEPFNWEELINWDALINWQPPSANSDGIIVADDQVELAPSSLDQQQAIAPTSNSNAGVVVDNEWENYFDWDAFPDDSAADDSGGEGPSVPRQSAAHLEQAEDPRTPESANSPVPVFRPNEGEPRHQTFDAHAAEQRRETQRTDKRAQREQEAEDDNDRRRRVPQRDADWEMSAGEDQPTTDVAREELLRRERRLKQPARSGSVAQRTAARDAVAPTPRPSADAEGAPAVGPPAPISRVDAARTKLSRARAAKRTHEQTQPGEGSTAGRDAWRKARHKLAQDVRQAQTEFRTALYGKPNVTTRAAAKRQADAARLADAAQAQAAQRQASLVQQRALPSDVATQPGLAAERVRAEQAQADRRQAIRERHEQERREEEALQRGTPASGHQQAPAPDAVNQGDAAARQAASERSSNKRSRSGSTRSINHRTD